MWVPVSLHACRGWSSLPSLPATHPCSHPGVECGSTWSTACSSGAMTRFGVEIPVLLSCLSTRSRLPSLPATHPGVYHFMHTEAGSACPPRVFAHVDSDSLHNTDRPVVGLWDRCGPIVGFHIFRKIRFQLCLHSTALNSVIIIELVGLWEFY